MANKNKCDGCVFLNKRKKTAPCEKGFKAVFEEGLYIRPSKCKVKEKKVDPIKELKKWKARAITAFQTYIKYRDNWTCVVCGKKVNINDPKERQQMNAGHFLSRKFVELTLNPKNCYAQCAACNLKQDIFGLHPKFIRYFIEVNGLETLMQFEQSLGTKSNNDIEAWKKSALFWEKELEEIKKEDNNHKMC